MRKPKYADLLMVFDQTSRENTVLAIALQELVLGRVKWLRSGCFSAGLVRMTGAHGGIAIIRWRCKGQDDTVSAYYADDFLMRWSNYIMPRFGDVKEAEAALHLCELIKQERYRLAKELDAAIPIVTAILDGVSTPSKECYECGKAILHPVLPQGEAECHPACRREKE